MPTVEEIAALKRRYPHLHFSFRDGRLHVERPPLFFLLNKYYLDYEILKNKEGYVLLIYIDDVPFDITPLFKNLFFLNMYGLSVKSIDVDISVGMVVVEVEL